MAKSPRIDNDALLAAGLELMKLNGTPLTKKAGFGRAMLYALPNGQVVRIRTTNDHALIVVATSPSPQDTTLNLSSDLSKMFPAALRRVNNPELKALLKTIDPTPNSRRDSGAIDWADLPDRLHFIADFFRCYQESPDLMLPPFADEQVVLMNAGKRPEGRL